ncbi:MAG: UDP-N-acetylglucosamine diphosphorylase/glucosamine-1-phosphate N-acetyltransferase [Nitrospirae bacterium]|nr:MAG: UDP-N-acetylglucosamine diphosphorylase/glucosamine-1-phosphate N-acetyltransferase [Nitrospirota bacterium]
MKRSLHAVVLAAGEGTRMRSSLPKVLHRILGIPMITLTVRAVREAGIKDITVVVGRKNGVAIKHVLTEAGARFVTQRRPLGTADALKEAIKEIGVNYDEVFLINGDTPLIRPSTVKKLIGFHRRNRNALSLISFFPPDPRGYGRIIRNPDGSAISIVEQKDLSGDQKGIKEVNSGIYIFSKEVLPLLKKIKKNPLKGEYYVTDIFSLAINSGLKVGVMPAEDDEEFHGVNTKNDLLEAQHILRRRVVAELLEKDVSFIDETGVYIQPGVKIGAGTIVYPGVVIEGDTKVGKNCVIRSNVRINNSRIGSEVVIKDSSIIEDSVVNDGSEIGPHGRLRPGTRLGRGVKIGNFVEVKNSTIGSGTKAQHLSYIGDAKVGKGVNIGAGTITCNYDGKKKHKTVIGDGVFVGSDTQLVAPVKIGKNAYIGAGSTITRDVPPGALAVARGRQTVKRNWAKNKK